MNTNEISVAGRNWSSANIFRTVHIEGKTIREILIDALCRFRGKKFDELSDAEIAIFLDRCRCKVDGVEIDSKDWSTYKPSAGSFVEFIIAPGKGGGGKNVLSAVLMVAVIVAASITQQWYLTTYGVASLNAAGAAATGMAAGTAISSAGVGLAATAVEAGLATWTLGSAAIGYGLMAGVAIGGSLAISALCPTISSPQTAQASSAASSSNTYSINGSHNAISQYGYIPLVLGKYRFSGILGAKSWTKWEGENQYFNMLVIWGHSDMSVTDFRIGENPLSNYTGVTHIFHGATTGNDLKLFNRSYNETSIGAELKYNQPIERVIGECDRISVDIYFPALANVSSGHASGASVNFKIEYALNGTNNWQTYWGSSKFYCPEQYVDCYTGASAIDIWATSDGTWHVRQSSEDWDNPNWSTGMVQVSNKFSPWPIKRYKDKHKHHEWWMNACWYDNGNQPYVNIGASSTSPISRTFEWAVPHGDYKVRITRLTYDQNSDQIYDDATWSVARAITNKAAFNTPLTVACSELRIKASEQLSGYVDDFNALCWSRFPVYGLTDGKDTYGWQKDADGDWIVDETQNPADMIRYLLTNRHALETPYTDAKIDYTSLNEFASWCLEKDYHFDYVCDTEVSAWNRLLAVASAGRGTITTDNDGKFGVSIDHDRKTISQMFTPRNSWGFSIDRTFYELPHALRVSWYDETDDYNNKEGFIYADGYNKSNATNIVEWSLVGKTRWKEVYRMGRYYLAATKLRPVTITLSTDWEWMMCRRGDLVGVSHDVLMNTFGTARIVSLIYRDSNNTLYYVNHEEDKPEDVQPVGVRIDDSVYFSEDTSYGIAVRNKSGNVLTYQIHYEFETETSDLLFMNAITAAQCPYIGALASVATFGKEYEKYIVTGITVSNDNSAELILAPYAMPEILNSEWSTIPDWKTPIMLPTIGGNRSLPAPIIQEIKSDETMLKWSGSSLISCLGVWYRLPDGIDSALGKLTCQGKITRIDDEGSVAYQSVETSVSNSLIFENVEDGADYKVQIRLISETGRTSEWTTVDTYTVIGKSRNPNSVKNFKLTNAEYEGIMASWDLNDERDVVKYSLYGDYSKITDYSPTYFLPYNKVGTVTEYIKAIDMVGLESKEGTKATFTINPPSAPNITSCRLLDNGINISHSTGKTTWPIDYYQVTACNTNVSITKSNTSVVTVPPTWMKGDTVRVRGIDIFKNTGGDSSEYPIAYFPPKTPKVSIGYDKLNGNVTIDWNDCRNDIEGAPSIDHYEISGTLGQGNVISVKGTHYEAIIPLTTYEMDDMLVNVRTLSVSVNAVDKYGVTSKDAANYKDNTVSISIEPPFNPTDFGIKASTEGDSLVLNWKDCTSTFAIDYYLVTDVSNDTIYKVSTNYVVLPSRAEGQYQVAVQAFDVLGQESSIMIYNLVVGGVGGMEVEGTLDGADILLTWSIPDSSFNVDYYIVMKDNDTIPNIDNVNNFIDAFKGLGVDDIIIPTDEDGNVLYDNYTVDGENVIINNAYGPQYGMGALVGRSKTNYLRIPGGQAGSSIYYVWAVDVAGNVSENYASFAVVTIDKPSAPSLTAGLSGDGVGLNWVASLNGSTQLPIATWDVRRYDGSVTLDNITSKTPVEDYGRLDVDTTTVPAFTVGKYRFAVRAIDTGGNIGDWAFADFTAVAPGRVMFNEPLIIDNNVQLYWTQPNTIFFPIREYLFEEVEYGEDNTEYGMEIGRVDALFASETEAVSGTYTYGITPIDVGGNLGTRTTITCRVSQPSDFVFFDKVDSLFNGIKTNFVLDGQGHMIGPVLVGETWEQNKARIEDILGTSISSHKDKVDAGYNTWLEPYVETATYTEVIDHKTVVPSSSITITPTYKALKGSPNISCKIETSQDGNTWDLVSDNALVVYATSFRYTRFTITVTGGYISLSKIVADLSIKKLSDYGRVECLSTDNGEGFISESQTPMLTGTYVPFHVLFTDVQSGPMVTARNTDYKAYIAFEDVLHPEGFRIFVKDKNGNRVSDTVDWVAYGV